MSKIFISALALSLLLLVFSCVLYAFDLPVWLPVVLVVLSVVLVALTAYKVAKKMRKETRKYSATTGSSSPMTPMRYRFHMTPPPAPRR